MTVVRYTAIQFLAYGIDMITFFLVLSMEAVDPIFANVMAKLIAGFFAFIAHRNFTFLAANNVSPRGQAIKYFLLLGFNIPLSSAILVFLLIFFPEPVLAKFIADVICVGLTYLFSKYVIFKISLKSVKLDSTRAAE